jgi:hypothetical protein
LTITNNQFDPEEGKIFPSWEKQTNDAVGRWCFHATSYRWQHIMGKNNVRAISCTHMVLLTPSMANAEKRRQLLLHQDLYKLFKVYKIFRILKIL